jgi:hypothetical protein
MWIRPQLSFFSTIILTTELTTSLVMAKWRHIGESGSSGTQHHPHLPDEISSMGKTKDLNFKNLVWKSLKKA